jgi:CRISPR/Cas system-associated protein Cas5 (RAMP superfamily)
MLSEIVEDYFNESNQLDNKRYKNKSKSSIEEAPAYKRHKKSQKNKKMQHSDDKKVNLSQALQNA